MASNVVGLRSAASPLLYHFLAAMNQSSGRYISLRDTLKIMEFLVTLKSEFYLMDVFISVVLNALFNLCKINKRRQEQATENGIIPHLMKFVHVRLTSAAKSGTSTVEKRGHSEFSEVLPRLPRTVFWPYIGRFLEDNNEIF
ncbi:MAP3K epsilon protein kinase 1 [Zea mays]|uniref:MAP3K epsilon protein kinase 1 n=1 Tax=Zea mays TaxID=4577 RepID=A0A3L6F640_MAIZE|nr:MAP3K epsilon protein kinase 1 [Zea mays]